MNLSRLAAEGREREDRAAERVELLGRQVARRGPPEPRRRGARVQLPAGLEKISEISVIFCIFFGGLVLGCIKTNCFK